MCNIYCPRFVGLTVMRFGSHFTSTRYETKQFLTLLLQQLMTELLSSDGASLNTTLNYKYDESHVLHKIPLCTTMYSMTHFHTRGYSTSTVLLVVRLMLRIILFMTENSYIRLLRLNLSFLLAAPPKGIFFCFIT
jgi:hypothetical protein